MTWHAFSWNGYASDVALALRLYPLDPTLSVWYYGLPYFIMGRLLQCIRGYKGLITILKYCEFSMLIAMMLITELNRKYQLSVSLVRKFGNKRIKFDFRFSSRFVLFSKVISNNTNLNRNSDPNYRNNWTNYTLN